MGTPLGHEGIHSMIYLAMSEAQVLDQQRKVNPLANVAPPASVRKKPRS